METNSYKAKLETLIKLAEERMPKLPYHNYRHAIDVYAAANTFAIVGGVNYEGRFLLSSAALLHDIIMVPGKKDNEEQSAEFARGYLPQLFYSPAQIERVGKIILATKMPQKPTDYLDEIICDADLDNLGRADFFDLGEKVRQELNVPAGERWNQGLLAFLKGHSYHTRVARDIRDVGKAANIQELEKILRVGKC